ncbi:unnamed protein product, partial [Staurois parvus]
MVGVTSQGSGAGEWSDKPGIRAGSAENQTGTGTGTENRAQEKHSTKAESAGLNVPKYTSIISSRCLTGCKVESLIAGSTRWPALVLQLIRQVSPNIAGQSIPD